MRRTLATAILAVTLAACSPYDTPANATPDQAITTSAVRSTPPMLYYLSAQASPGDPCRPGDKPCWQAHIEKRRLERIWWAEVVAQQRRRAEAARIARIYAFAHAIEQARLARIAAQSGGRIIDGIEVCNGRDLPSCAIVRRESGFNPRAENPTSSAAGLFQFIDSTWRTCGTGYGHASYAPVAVQVACARRIWNGGRGRGHWSL